MTTNNANPFEQEKLAAWANIADGFFDEPTEKIAAAPPKGMLGNLLGGNTKHFAANLEKLEGQLLKAEGGAASAAEVASGAKKKGLFSRLFRGGKASKKEIEKLKKSIEGAKADLAIEEGLVGSARKKAAIGTAVVGGGTGAAAYGAHKMGMLPPLFSSNEL
jgi:hypothetical protein